MAKKSNEALKLLLLIILVLSIPLVFISIEAIQKIKAVSEINPDEIVTNTLDELYQNIQAIPKNNDPSIIRKCLTEIFELMNEGNFTKVYSLLNDDQKELLFPTEEDFSTYMKNYLKDKKYSPNFSTYQKLNQEKDDVFIVKVNFLPYSTDETNILSNTAIDMFDTFTLYVADDKSYKFSFLTYVGTNSTESSYENDKMKIKILKTHLYTSKTIFDIEITNKTNAFMNIEEKGIFCNTGLMSKYYTPSVYIPANDSIKITFCIYTGINLKDSLPTEIRFSGIHLDGYVYSAPVTINYPVKLY